MKSPVKIWRHQKKIRVLLNKVGKIISYTTIYVPPSGFEAQTPYTIAIADFGNSLRLTAQVVDTEPVNIKIGQKIRTVLRRTREVGQEGVIPYGVKFKPIV